MYGCWTDARKTEGEGNMKDTSADRSEEDRPAEEVFEDKEDV